tara:strand:+ start:2283 stop:2474 length:192 start_codon:yes stop_codon:yes gene_type:complete
LARVYDFETRIIHVYSKYHQECMGLNSPADIDIILLTDLPLNSLTEVFDYGNHVTGKRKKKAI